MNSAEIIAVTQPVGKLSDVTVDEFIAYVARVSNPNNQNNTKTAPKLIKYLLDNSHVSPLDMANVVMEINTTRDIARQVLRHGSAKFQEFSQRYQNVGELGFTYREARLQDKKNRQNSIDIDDEILKAEWLEKQKNVINAASDAYKWALDNGIALEQARVVLPEGLTMSRMYMNGTVRTWIFYLAVRLHRTTQKEHRELAYSAYTQLKGYFPSLQEPMLKMYYDELEALGYLEGIAE